MIAPKMKEQDNEITENCTLHRRLHKKENRKTLYSKMEDWETRWICIYYHKSCILPVALAWEFLTSQAPEGSKVRWLYCFYVSFFRVSPSSAFGRKHQMYIHFCLLYKFLVPIHAVVSTGQFWQCVLKHNTVELLLRLTVVFHLL